jgi:hypothetical protein
LPRFAAIVRSKQPAGDRAAPQHAGFVVAAGFEDPHQLQLPGDLDAAHRAAVRLTALGRRRILRHAALLPRLAGVARGVKLGAEMIVLDRGVKPAVAPIGQHHGHVVADERLTIGRPSAGRAAPKREKALARRDVNSITHRRVPLSLPA